jgi:hypothetical protein
MATINYTTLELPKELFDYTRVIQITPHFEVRRYIVNKGIIFRIPLGAKVGQIFHAFMEHEINLSNTLRTGTLTMKIQITLVPCHIGVFSGFKKLRGSYVTIWEDEDYGFEYFKPDYENEGNVRNIIPLPPNIKTNLYEYLNEIIFKYVDDADVINKYAVDLGCKKEVIKDCFVPLPVQTSHSKKGTEAFNQTIDFFNEITSGNGLNMLPECSDNK